MSAQPEPAIRLSVDAIAGSVTDAISQLARSERGRQALADLHALLEHGGTGLDAANWGAIGALVVSCMGDGRRAYKLCELVAPFRGATRSIPMHEQQLERTSASLRAFNAARGKANRP